jgi:AraC family transcriptional regulator
MSSVLCRNQPGSLSPESFIERCPESVTASEIRFKPNAFLAQHAHDKPHFCAILEGGYTGRYGTKSQEGHPSDTVYRPAGERHSVRFHDVETRVLIIEFTFDFLGRVAERGLDLSSNFCSGKVTWLAKRVWAEHNLGDSCSQLAIEGLLLEMLAQVSRRQTPGKLLPAWLFQVKDQIQETCGQRFSVDDLAKTANVHPVYLVTAFKKAFRLTPGEFQRHVRIHRAEELMSKMPAMPLSEVALVTGFFDQSHFSRAFKHVTGLTPSTFRQMSTNLSKTQDASVA